VYGEDIYSAIYAMVEVFLVNPQQQLKFMRAPEVSIGVAGNHAALRVIECIAKRHTPALRRPLAHPHSTGH